jgi:transcriptional regulator with XRE-family HTH domain
MIIGDRLRAFREAKRFSHGDVEKRTGLLRRYISRVENATLFLLSKSLKNWPAY